MLNQIAQTSFAIFVCSYIYIRCKSATPKKLVQNSAVEKISTAEDSVKPKVEIEYCTGCRWMLRAAWIGQELLTTFQSELHSVSLIPNSKEGGVFNIYAISSQANTSCERHLIWSRKIAKRFPESKEVKQLLRDFIAPQKDLGHSDRKS